MKKQVHIESLEQAGYREYEAYLQETFPQERIFSHYFPMDRMKCYYFGEPPIRSGQPTNSYGEEIAVYSADTDRFTLYKSDLERHGYEILSEDKT